MIFHWKCDACGKEESTEVNSFAHREHNLPKGWVLTTNDSEDYSFSIIENHFCEACKDIKDIIE